MPGKRQLIGRGNYGSEFKTMLRQGWHGIWALAEEMALLTFRLGFTSGNTLTDVSRCVSPRWSQTQFCWQSSHLDKALLWFCLQFFLFWNLALLMIIPRKLSTINSLPEYCVLSLQTSLVTGAAISLIINALVTWCLIPVKLSNIEIHQNNRPVWTICTGVWNSSKLPCWASRFPMGQSLHT